MESSPRYYHSGGSIPEHCSEDGEVQNVNFATYRVDEKHKSGFINNVVNKLDQKKRRFTTGGFSSGGFSSNVGIVNGFGADSYSEFGENNNTSNASSIERCSSVSGTRDTHPGGKTPERSRSARILQRMNSASLPHISLPKNFNAIKGRLTPTHMNKQLPPHVKKMKDSFVGNRKTSLPTYIAANIRRNSDVNNLVEDDNVFVEHQMDILTTGSEEVPPPPTSE